MQFGVVVEDVRQVEEFELLDAERTELGQRGGEHLHGAELQRFHLFLVLVQRRVGVDLDFDLALGQFRGALGKELGSLTLGRVERHDMAELDDDRLLRESRQRYGGQGTGDEAEKQGGNLHELSPPLSTLV